MTNQLQEVKGNYSQCGSELHIFQQTDEMVLGGWSNKAVFCFTEIQCNVHPLGGTLYYSYVFAFNLCRECVL